MDIKHKLRTELSKKQETLFNVAERHVAEISVTGNNNHREFNQLMAAQYNGNQVQNSTTSSDENDYIHNEVAAVVDTNTAITMKGLIPNEKLVIEVQPMGSDDAPAAKQTAGLLDHIFNVWNDPRQFLSTAITDDGLYGAAFLHVGVVNHEDSRVVSFQGTEKDMRVWRQRIVTQPNTEIVELSRRKLEQIDYFAGREILFEEGEEAYDYRFRVFKHEQRIKVNNLDGDYIIAQPLLPTVEDQDFLGTVTATTVGNAVKDYGCDLDKLFAHGKKRPEEKIAGSAATHVINTTNLIEPEEGAKDDKSSKEISVVKGWLRSDKDGIIEITYSGDYIISMYTVDFVPVVRICGTPFPHNFWGSSLALRSVLAQEYNTAMVRSGIDYALAASDNQIFANGDHLELDALEDDSTYVLVDNDFEPGKHLGEVPKSLGDISPVIAMHDIVMKNKRGVTGVFSADDIVNNEIMNPGNSAIKLQIASNTLNQLAEQRIKSVSSGIKELANIVWKTSVQMGALPEIMAIIEDVGQSVSEAPTDVFLDYETINNDFNFIDRTGMQLKLAIGMHSEENLLAGYEYQIELRNRYMIDVMGLLQQGIDDVNLLEGHRRLYVEPYEKLFGRSDVDSIIPTVEETLAIAERVSAETPDPEPTFDEQAKLAGAQTKQFDAETKRMKTIGDLRVVPFEEALKRAQANNQEAQAVKNTAEAAVAVTDDDPEVVV